MFQSLLLVPLGFAVLWLRYREGRLDCNRARVGCDVVDFVYQFVGIGLYLAITKLGKIFG